ncbi:hypothetical protein ATANTOWER_028699 [Ataeniobius toweri]|uniref:Uncharacterized protein n=1 Tax=Ataeniobius toweri TaxID=208326 RepID=A0ABU7BJR6_9TELE|nr:hypothetical protein [Ataeniobius toweri]
MLKTYPLFLTLLFFILFFPFFSFPHLPTACCDSNVDTKELCDYFAKHMGDYEGVLASLETLNLSILRAMDFTKKVGMRNDWHLFRL